MATPSSSSQPPPSQPRVKQLQAGQTGSVSPSKTLPLSIAVPQQDSPNKFIPTRRQADDEALSLKTGKVDSSDFLKSLGADRRRMDSEESSSSQENSFLAMLNKMQPKEAPLEEVDMSQTMMDVSVFHHNQEDSEEEETDKVDSGNFLAGLATSEVDRTEIGGGMDMTSVGGRLEKTRVGGGMDITLAVGGMDMTRNGGGVDVTRVGGANMDMTSVDVMDMTGASGLYDVTRPGTSLDVTKPGQSGMDHTRIGGSNMDMTRIGGSNMDMTRIGGANMDMIKIGGSNMDMTRIGGSNMDMTRIGGANMDMTKIGGSNMDMTRIGGSNMDMTRIGGANMDMTKIGGSNMDMTKVGGSNMDMTRIGGSIMDMTKVRGSNMEMTRVWGNDMNMTRADDGMEMTGAVGNILQSRVPDDDDTLEIKTVGENMEITRQEETPVDDDGMEMTRAVGQMELTRMGGGRMEMTNIGGGSMEMTRGVSNMEMTRLGGGMEITTDVRRLVSDQEEDVTITSQGSDSVFVNNSMMAEFRAAVSGATSVTSQPRIEDLPGSEPTSAETSSTAEADFGGGATATVKFSTLSLANNTLMLPRKESEEDEMTSCPVQLFSYDPAKPINDRVEENPANAVSAVTRPSILKPVEISRNEPTLMDPLKVSKDSTITPIPSTESLVPSSTEQSRATDESGWETMHSMIGLPPVTEPNLTPDIRASSIQTSRRSSRPSIRSIEEDHTPEQTACLGGLMMQKSRQFTDPDVSVFAPGEESTRAFKLLAPSLSEARTTVGSSIAEDSPEIFVRKSISKPSSLDLGDITTFSPDIEYESTRALHTILPRVARQPPADPQRIPDIPEAEEVTRRSLMFSNTEMVDVTRPGSRLGQQLPSPSPMMPGVNVTATPGDTECYDILGGHEDTHQDQLTQSKTGESHPLAEREESPPKRARLEDAEDTAAHQRFSLRNCLQDPQLREDSKLLEAESISKEDKQLPAEVTPMLTEELVSDPSSLHIFRPPLDQEGSILRSCSLAQASEETQPVCSEDVISSPKLAARVENDMENTEVKEVINFSLKETKYEVEITDSQSAIELNDNKNPPAIIPEEEVPVKDIVMTIFEDLKTKHITAGKKDWELVRHNEKLAAFGFLEKSLLLVLSLGDKLKPKRSRKSLGRIVHHWSIRDIKIVSTHRGTGTGQEDPDDNLLDTGKTPVVSFRKVIINIISAHHIVRRKLPEISLLSQCPNTHSLSSFLKDVSMVVSSTIDFIRSIQFVQARFFPFSVSDHKVTFGECYTTLLFCQLKKLPC